MNQGENNHTQSTATGAIYLSIVIFNSKAETGRKDKLTILLFHFKELREIGTRLIKNGITLKPNTVHHFPMIS